MPPFVFDARTANRHYPGIGRYTFELARALAAQTELTLIVNPLTAEPEMDLWALPARRVAVPATPRQPAQQWLVSVRLCRLRAALYHSPFYLMPYWPGPPTVLTAYDVIPLTVPEGFSARQRWLYRAAHHLAFWSARRVITLSQAAGADFGAHFGLRPERVSVIAPGLEPRFAPSGAAALAAFRADRGLPERYLLFVGSPKPHKNLPALIQARAQLPASAPPLLIAGPEDARFPQARQAAAGLGDQVRFLGRVPDADLPLLYAGATVYVHPARLEGFGFPVLEALGCGAPVVCADIPVLRELADTAAVYFDPRDPAALARALTTVLDSPSQQQAQRERGWHRARAFTWERAAAQTLAVYRQISAA